MSDLSITTMVRVGKEFYPMILDPTKIDYIYIDIPKDAFLYEITNVISQLQQD